jgi:aminoglycoside/choline kinase family phosphotransferase
MTAAQGALFNTLAERLARRVEALPSAFTHRDYQSRNLMVRSSAPPRLVWIDFQDALQGPRIYDMVALLNDSYQVFSPEFVEARLDDYAQAAGLGAAERASLSREFALVTVQRKLKDAGRFVFIDQVKKNPSFLKYVDPTLAKVERWLTKLSDDDDMAQLRRLLHEIGALDSRHA